MSQIKTLLTGAPLEQRFGVALNFLDRRHDLGYVFLIAQTDTARS